MKNESEVKVIQMETIAERDKKLKRLWAQFGNIPIDPENETLEEEFLHFPVGTDREDVWHWFDQRYSMGVVGLLYPGTDARAAENLYKLRQSCIECESKDCAFNDGGECRFPMVYERQPKITEDDGCTEYAFRG